MDALGNPTSLYPTAGQASDLDGADALLDSLPATTVIADKGHDADERVLKKLEKAGKTAGIPAQANRRQPWEYDKDLYQARHRTENVFAKLTNSEPSPPGTPKRRSASSARR